MGMDPTTMMMDAIFQPTLIPMPMTGNTEPTTPGIPLTEMIIHGTTHRIHHTEWVTDQVPGNTATDLNMTMMDVTLPQTPILMPKTGSMELITPGTPLTVMTTPGTTLGITHTEWVMEV